MTLGPKFEEALLYACRAHASHERKGTTIPYVSHLLSVSGLVLEGGGSEEEAIAALLHDVVEDQGGALRLEDVRSRFGDEVADIVDGCSDTDVVPKPPWLERKRSYVTHLQQASDSVIRVSLADKLHNARAILFDYRLYGDELWQRFDPQSDTLWYYRELVNAYRRRTRGPQLDELDRVVTELERLALSPEQSHAPTPNIQKRAKLALEARVRSTYGDIVNGASRCAELPQVLVPTLRGDPLAASLKDVRGGSGGELSPDGDRGPKFHSVYSSCAFAINMFGPWRLEPESLVVGSHTGFNSLAFEAKCRIFPKGTPPNLDVLVEDPQRILGIEVKLTEHLRPGHVAQFDAKYDAVIGGLDASWSQAFANLREDPHRYRFLNAAQLVKHAIGLRRAGGDRQVTLAYLFWEPSNAGSATAVIDHRQEVNEFAAVVAESESVRFIAFAAPDLWKSWDAASEPRWVREHVKALKARYGVAI